jgi:hypothetical protein
MQIYVKVFYSLTPSRPSLEILEVEASDSIESVKAKILDQISLPVHAQKLFFEGEYLEDKSTLSD